MKKQTIERNKDFRRQCLSMYYKELSGGGTMSVRDVINRVIKQSPLCYYDSYDQALRNLKIIRRYGVERFVCEGRERRKWVDMYGQVLEVCSRHSHLRFDKAVSFVLNFYRPREFYISYETGRHILGDNILRRWEMCV